MLEDSRFPDGFQEWFLKATFKLVWLLDFLLIDGWCGNRMVLFEISIINLLVLAYLGSRACGQHVVIFHWVVGVVLVYAELKDMHQIIICSPSGETEVLGLC